MIAIYTVISLIVFYKLQARQYFNVQIDRYVCILNAFASTSFKKVLFYNQNTFVISLVLFNFCRSSFLFFLISRLLFLLAARHWRGCVVLPAENDKDFIDGLCAKMYNEIEYIANHDLGLPDVVMEHSKLFF